MPLDPLQNVHRQIEAARKAALPNAHDLVTFRQYARGRHKGTLSPQQQRVLRSLVGNLFCDNVVGRVLSEVRNRLRLARFDVVDEAVLRFLKDLWTRAHLPAFSLSVHYAALRDGDHYVSLSWDNDRRRVVLTRELAWNGRYGMFLAYDALGEPDYAVKDWQDAHGRERRTLYLDGEIRRYRRGGGQGSDATGGWEPFIDEAAGDTMHPVPWTRNGRRSGEPLGLPVVHFANVQVPQDPDAAALSPSKGAGYARANETDPYYGASELDGGLVGLQDEVNDVHRDITAAARFAGYGMLYGTGLSRRVDANGEEISYTVEPGAFFESENPNSKFGRIDPASIEPLKETLRTKIEAISRMAGVPMFTIQGDWPSGEALIRAEMPLIDKVETIAASIGPAWATMAHKATILANTFGGAGLNEEALIEAVFSPATRRDLLTRVKIAKELAGLVSLKEQLRILEYSPEAIERILDEMSEERAGLLEAMHAERRALGLPDAAGGDGLPGDPDEIAIEIDRLARGAG